MLDSTATRAPMLAAGLLCGLALHAPAWSQEQSPNANASGTLAEVLVTARTHR